MRPPTSPRPAPSSRVANAAPPARPSISVRTHFARTSCWIAALALTLASSTLVGCDGGVDIEVTPDGGTSDAAVTLRRTLQVDGDASVAVLSGSEAELAFVLVDRFGVPVEGETVDFVFDGRAHDSSLAELSLVTDAQGRVRAQLLAGTEAASFRVRASADEASPVYVDVVVSALGLGDLQVTLGYAGERELSTREVAVFTGASCGPALLGATGDRTVVIDPEIGSGTFLGLPAGASLAIVGRGLGLAGGVLARGCVDVAGIAADETTQQAVVLEDVDPGLAGLFGVELALAAETALAAAVDEHRDAEDEAEAFFAEVVAALDDAGNGGAADALEHDRARHLASIVAELELREAGATATKELPADGMSGVSLELSGLLSIPSASDEAYAPSFQLRGVTAVVEGERVELETLMATREWNLAGEGAAVVVSDSTVALHRGAVARAIIESWESDDPDGESLPAELSGCATLETSLSAACDASCVAAACLRVAQERYEELLGALADEVGTEELSLSGTLYGEDTDANAWVDGLSGELTGRWSDEGAELGVEFSAQRTVAVSR